MSRGQQIDSAPGKGAPVIPHSDPAGGTGSLEAAMLLERNPHRALVCGHPGDAANTGSGSDRVPIPGRLGLISQHRSLPLPVLTLLRLLIYQRGPRI